MTRQISIQSAFLKAIKDVGLTNFKKCSFFSSNKDADLPAKLHNEIMQLKPYNDKYRNDKFSYLQGYRDAKIAAAMHVLERQSD